MAGPSFDCALAGAWGWAPRSCRAWTCACLPGIDRGPGQRTVLDDSSHVPELCTSVSVASAGPPHANVDCHGESTVRGQGYGEVMRLAANRSETPEKLVFSKSIVTGVRTCQTSAIGAYASASFFLSTPLVRVLNCTQQLVFPHQPPRLLRKKLIIFVHELLHRSRERQQQRG